MSYELSIIYFGLESCERERERERERESSDIVGVFDNICYYWLVTRLLTNPDPVLIKTSKIQSFF